MKIQLIKGSFSRQEALDLISNLIHVKIKFHEDKIMKHQHEEDVKMREKRIKELQHDLDKIRQFIADGAQSCSLDSEIAIELY